jgi:hypothetical protein
VFSSKSEAGCTSFPGDGAVKARDAHVAPAGVSSPAAAIHAETAWADLLGVSLLYVRDEQRPIIKIKVDPRQPIVRKGKWRSICSWRTSSLPRLTDPAIEVAAEREPFADLYLRVVDDLAFV